MDLTKYGTSPYGPGSLLRGDQNQSPLAAALRGFLGQEEPGSVFDSAAAPNRAINNAVQLGSTISDLVPGRAAMSGVPAAMGMIRKGGRPDLFLTHGTNVRKLLNNNKVLTELTHPSMGITRDAPETPWAKRDGSVTLVARPDVFDPVRYPASLHNTDAWTPGYLDALHRPIGYAPRASTRTEAKLRLADRFEHRFDKGGLNAVDETVIGSTRFPSFEAYENSPLGADLLTRFARGTEGFLSEVQAQLTNLERIIAERLAEERGIKRPGEYSLGTELSKLASGDTPLGFMFEDVLAAQNLIKELRRVPQQYAELKAWGHVPVTGSSFSHVIANSKDFDSMDWNNLSSVLDDRGIKVIDWVPKTEKQWADLADYINAQALRSYKGNMRALPE